MSIPESKISLFYHKRSYEVDKSFWHTPPIMMPYKGRIIPFGVAVMRNNFIYDITEDTMSKLIQAGIPQVNNFLINMLLGPDI